LNCNSKSMKQFKIALVYLLILTSACKRMPKDIPAHDPVYGRYIAAYTTGYVERDAEIKIVLNTELKLKKDIDLDEVFEFQPRISGKVVWKDDHTLHFIPDEELDRNQVYVGVFHLGNVVRIKKELKRFPLRFQTRQQSVQLQVRGLETYERGSVQYRKLTGRIYLADKEKVEAIEPLLHVHLANKSYPVKWSRIHDRAFQFEVDSLRRSRVEQEIEIHFNAKPLDAVNPSERRLKFPGTGEFKFSELIVEQEPDQKLEIYFSEKLSPFQNLKGLIEIEGTNGYKSTVDGNKVLIFFDQREAGEYEVEIQGIRNFSGEQMKGVARQTFELHKPKPRIKLVGEGTIVPGSDFVAFPFDAIGIKKVDVWIYKVFADNVPQFLQVNNMDGARQLGRVGHLIHEGSLELTDPDSMKYKRYSLNLAQFIKQEPGAIYRVMLSFKPEYTFCKCKEPFSVSTSSSSLHYNYYRDENYFLHEDPCSRSYYYNNSIIRNVLCSNIGLMAKAGEDEVIHVFANDLSNAEPLSGVFVQAISYQNQILAKGYTNSQGMLEIKNIEVPYVLKAKKNKEVGYLKLQNGALSTSKFDVSGVYIRKQLDAKLYAERGVWRPGDSIYLCMAIQDMGAQLPYNTPVELKVFNPKGVLVTEKIVNRQVGGIYDLRFGTKGTDETGTYRASAMIAGQTFYKSLPVETVKPNRLKIHLDFSDSLLRLNKPWTMDLNARWLHGAVAKNLKHEVQAHIQGSDVWFKQAKEFSFSHFKHHGAPVQQTLSKGYLDSTGFLKIRPNWRLNRQLGGRLKVKFNIKVFEPGGNFSIYQDQKTVYAFNSYVGIRLPEYSGYSLASGKKHNLEFCKVQADGEFSDKGKVHVRVMQVSWRWWWNRYDNMASYMEGKSLDPVIDTVLNIRNGVGTLPFLLPEGQYGRFLIVAKDVESGHESTRVFYAGRYYGNWRNEDQSDQLSMLDFEMSDKAYKPGELVQVKLPKTTTGKALVCVENGSKVLMKRWVDAGQYRTFHFTASKDMFPNAYVHISLVQPFDRANTHLPARLYGIKNVRISDRSTRLNPQIKIKETIRPDRQETLTISEKNNKSMTYTLAIVDEGLLDLTSFRTPDLHKEFYKKQRLGVRTWDMYDQVFYGAGNWTDNVLSVGGDEAVAPVDRNHRANRFKPCVRFLGPFHLTPGGVKTHKIKLDNYIGAVRVMVVAKSGRAYGSHSKSVKVKKPLMVQATLPRVLSPGDEIKVPVQVFCLKEGTHEVEVRGVFGKHLELQDGEIRKVRFDKPGDKLVYYHVKIAESTGNTRVNVYAKMGKEKAETKTDLNIRLPNEVHSEVKEYVVQAGQEIQIQDRLNGMDGTNSAVLEVSSLPSINLHERLSYLMQYPHGCVEQTTSSVFPQLFLSELTTLTENQEVQVVNNIQQGIDRLRSFQTASGGLGYWPGRTEANDWGTVYATHYLVKAKAKGYHVPKTFYEHLLKYLKRSSRQWSSNNEGYSQLTQAYRLYVLALAGEPDIASMNRLYEQANITENAKWRLAAAYAVSGKLEAAKKLMDKQAKPSETGYNPTFGSALRDQALILETMALLEQKEKMYGLVKKVANTLSSRRWLNTQETAYCLVSLSPIYAKKTGDKEVRYTMGHSGKQHSRKTSKSMISEDLYKESKKAEMKLTFKNTSSDVLYVRLIKRFVPLKIKTDTVQSYLKTSVQFKTMGGLPLDVSSLEKGTQFKAEVTVFNPGTAGHLSELALTQMFPSGWEIDNSRFLGTSSGGHVYQDFRDDRVYTYFNLRTGGSHKVELQLTATYEGSYYLPATLVEHMYQNHIHSSIPGKMVRVN
jgi:uncharacterized protein YfaS (alpha-2-macroglobulin family)